MQIVPGSEEDRPGQVTINSQGAEARERAKWETLKTEYTDRIGITAHFRPGNPLIKGNPNKPLADGPYKGHGGAGGEYPKMLYRAVASPLHNNQMRCMLDEPMPFHFPSEDQWSRARDAVQHFNTACQVTVNDEAEDRAARIAGAGDTPQAAMEIYKGARNEVFTQTGHREWDDRNMSDAAKAEKRAFEDANPGHQPEVTRTPVVKSLTREEEAAQLRARLAELEPAQDDAARKEAIVAKRKATIAAKKAKALEAAPAA